jgi:hypothetical protein
VIVRGCSVTALRVVLVFFPALHHFLNLFRCRAFDFCILSCADVRHCAIAYFPFGALLVQLSVRTLVMLWSAASCYKVLGAHTFRMQASPLFELDSK